MTDKEIIKALECCGNGEDCLNCPLQDDYADCNPLSYAYDLINRQQAEIERLEKLSKDRADVNFEKIVGVVDRARADIKAEAIKEFAERLCEGRVSNDPVVIAVKAELKEMVGEEK